MTEPQTQFEARTDGTQIVRLHGRVDFLSSTEIKRQITESVRAGHIKLVVDLAGVDMLDSSGLSALIGGLKAARQAGGDLRVARLPEQAKTVFRLTSLDRVFRVYDTVEEALAGY